MITLPKSDRRAKTGSNVRGNPLPAHYQKFMARRRLAHQRLAKEYAAKLRPLVTASDRRRAAELVAAAREAWRKTQPSLGRTVEEWEQGKQAAQAKLNRLLGRALKHYRPIRKLQRDYRRAYRKLAGSLLDQLIGPGWGPLPETPGEPRQYQPPYPLYEVHTTVDGYHPFEWDELSSATPSLGWVLNSFKAHKEDDTAAILGLFGMLWDTEEFNVSSVGIAYTMPISGRLQIFAEFQNYYNNIKLALRDNFGFSSGDLQVTVNLLVSIMTPQGVTQLRKAVVTFALGSDGDDRDTVMPYIEQGVLLTLDDTTSEAFTQGQSMWILAGTEIVIACTMDDMTAYVDAVLFSKVTRIRVGVTP